MRNRVVPIPAPRNNTQMISTEEKIKIHGNPASGSIEIAYSPQTERTLFDICDVNGRIIKTGQITSDITKVAVNDIGNDEQYIVLILDGDRVCSCRFRL